jgi:hypothetical protein
MENQVKHFNYVENNGKLVKAPTNNYDFKKDRERMSEKTD